MGCGSSKVGAVTVTDSTSGRGPQRNKARATLPPSQSSDMGGKASRRKIGDKGPSNRKKSGYKSDHQKAIDDCLRAHNKYRSLHGAAPLQINDDLSKAAQQWADHLSTLGRLEHCQDCKFEGQPVGQSLSWRSFYSTNIDDVNDTKFDGAALAKTWYDEVDDPGYDFDNPGFSSATGHFTQLVWKSTRQLGIGVTRKQSDNTVEFYVVARYFPAGNINTQSHFRDNVLRLGSAITSASRSPERVKSDSVSQSFISSSDRQKVINDCLRSHNEYRRLHGADPLQINDDLSRAAQQWADQLTKIGSLVHCQDREYQGQSAGENLAWKSFFSSDIDEVNAMKPDGEWASKGWYDEIDDPGYDFNNPGFAPGTGHFTQLVWKSSRQLGVGVAKKQSGNTVEFYVVARYFPAGNINSPDYFRENVLRPHS